jgi:hypothetical protein
MVGRCCSRSVSGSFSLLGKASAEECLLRTESFDDLGDVGEDPTWEKMAAFHEYLEKAFPLV